MSSNGVIKVCWHFLFGAWQPSGHPQCFWLFGFVLFFASKAGSCLKAQLSSPRQWPSVGPCPDLLFLGPKNRPRTATSSYLLTERLWFVKLKVMQRSNSIREKNCISAVIWSKCFIQLKSIKKANLKLNLCQEAWSPEKYHMNHILYSTNQDLITLYSYYIKNEKTALKKQEMELWTVYLISKQPG